MSTLRTPKTQENSLSKDAVTNAEGRYKIGFTEEDFKAQARARADRGDEQVVGQGDLKE